MRQYLRSNDTGDWYAVEQNRMGTVTLAIRVDDLPPGWDVPDPARLDDYLREALPHSSLPKDIDYGMKYHRTQWSTVQAVQARPNWGGRRPGAGRKPTRGPMRKTTIWMNDEDRATLQQLGEGDMARGFRRMLTAHAAAGQSDPPSTDPPDQSPGGPGPPVPSGDPPHDRPDP